ncbi:MAG: hypothetical protein ACR2FY_00780 [Pirellulaceae bacterium]
MPLPKGRRVRLSAARGLVVEMLRACRGFPTVVAERRLELGDLVAARRQAAVRPAWSVIIAKAFAIVAADMPSLRQSFIAFPWAYLYEHAEPVASIVVEREYQGENIVFIRCLRQAHLRPLANLDAQMRHAKEASVESVAEYRLFLRLARMPWPLRRFLLWLSFRASGRLREQHIGTFGLTSPACEGAGMSQLITPLTATLHYGLLDAGGGLDMRLTFDHRVLDGAEAARALVALEKTLCGAILAEVRQLAVPRKAA